MLSIVRLDYNPTVVGVRAMYRGVEQEHLLRFRVDEVTVLDALKRCQNNSSVVAYDYTGELDFLKEHKRQIGSLLAGKSFIYYLDFDSVYEALDYNFATLPKLLFVRYMVRFRGSDNLSIKDLRTMSEISQRFSNVAFCCKGACRFSGINLGCITELNCNVKGKEVLRTKYCSCVVPTLNLEDMDGVVLIRED